MPKPENVEPYKWKPGLSGNLAGAPKGPRLSTLLKAMLDASTPDEVAKAKFMTAFYTGKRKPTNAHAYAARLLKSGLIDGDLGALKEIADRVEGKAMQAVELSGKDGGPIATTATIVINGVKGTAMRPDEPRD